METLKLKSRKKKKRQVRNTRMVMSMLERKKLAVLMKKPLELP